MKLKLSSLVSLVLVSISTIALAKTPVECIYPSKTLQQLSRQGICGYVDEDNSLHVSSDHLQKILFERNGLQCIYLPDGRVFYLNSEGKSIKTPMVDNGCDYFRQGLARTNIDGKIAYFDTTLTIVFQTKFEYAAPFYAGYADVCYGPMKVKMVGEHKMFESEKCGLINLQGGLVLPAKHSLKDYGVFRNYRNSHNECEIPPIVNKKQALCHSLRHLKNSSSSPSNGFKHKERLVTGVWTITLIEKRDNGYKTIMKLSSQDASMIVVTSEKLNKQN